MSDLTQSIPPAYALAGFALIVISAMMCWTVSTTDSADRADVLRAFAELVGIVFDGLRNLRRGRPDDASGLAG